MPGRDRGHPQAADLLLHRGARRDGGQHHLGPREARPGGDRRVPAREPPARLPGLRQGRRVPAPGHLVRLGRGQIPRRRSQAPLQEAARAVAAGRDRPRALHPLLPLRALLAGGGRGLPARVPRPRRPHVRRHPRRPPLRGAVQRQHHRAVPGGRAHLHRVPLPRAPVGHRGVGHGLHDVPVAVQRRADRARRRQGRARARARQRGGRRRLALRQGPLRLPGVWLARADHRPAGARRRLPARGVVGAGLDGGGAGLGAGGRTNRRAGRRLCHQRRGLPGPAPDAPGARLAPRGLACGRAPLGCARPSAGRARAVRACLRHRPRRRDPRARHRARGGGADPRPARAQGGAPQRRPPGGGVGAAVDARPQLGRRAALRAGHGRGRDRRPGECARQPARRIARRAGREGARLGRLPGGLAGRRRSRLARRRRARGGRRRCATPATWS